MAKKKLAKAIVCLGALGVATKVAYGKYKTAKETYAQEEADSVGDEVKKYNALFEKKIIEVEDEEFTGCEIKAVSSSIVVDLGLAIFNKDVYINFTSTASNLTIILPEGVNAACDVTRTASGMRNLIENVEEEDIHTVYIIGKATCSNVEVIPVNFYVDDDDDFEDISDKDDYEVVVDNTVTSKADETVVNQTDAGFDVTVAVEKENDNTIEKNDDDTIEKNDDDTIVSDNNHDASTKSDNQEDDDVASITIEPYSAEELEIKEVDTLND